MSDELSTKLSLDLDTRSVEANIQSLTGKMNCLIRQMNDMNKGFNQAGKSGEA